MIDIERDVYTVMASALPSSVNLQQHYQKESKIFPTVTVEEVSNAVYEPTIDSGAIENYVLVAYEVNVYVNGVNRKSEAKTLMASCDDVMAGLHFTRSSLSFIPNQDDSSVYRMTARYYGIVDTNKNIYRR